MFYVKEQLNDAMEVSIEINDENVFCRCPHCGSEVQVDFADVFADGDVDLFGTAVLCDNCSRKLMGGAACGYNSEGYPDPTTYEALTSIEKETKAVRAYRPIVYVCSPFSGDVAGNIANARKYSRFAVEQGYIPIAPHLLFPQFLNDNDLTERELGLHFGNVLMSHCSEVWVFGEIVSAGMDAEIRRAKRKNYRLRYFGSDLKEVTENA